jgi:hypothetical protein
LFYYVLSPEIADVQSGAGSPPTPLRISGIIA